MTESQNPSNSELARKIRTEILEKGRMTFARFMERALYEPDEGYYMTGSERIGLGGDYYTSADVSPIFGRLLARQIRQMGEILPKDKPLTILEIGAGKGLLARDVLTGLRDGWPDAFQQFRYVVLERSPGMVKKQKDLLRSAGFDDSVDWIAGLDELASGEPLTGCILSNEFMDALPVHRLVGTKDGLKEIYVDIEGDKFMDAVDRASDPALPAYFESAGIALADGQQAEVCLEAGSWMRAIGKALGQGFVITIDYGHPTAELYAEHRKKGTLLCYFRHTANDDPYSRIGEQDITAHVDFTALARAGAEAGLSVTGFTNQLNFLMGLGMDHELAGYDPESSEIQSAKRLLARESMGGVFKVLIQHKGLEPPPLDGLSFRPFIKDALGTGTP